MKVEYLNYINTKEMVNRSSSLIPAVMSHIPLL